MHAASTTTPPAARSRRAAALAAVATLAALAALGGASLAQEPAAAPTSPPEGAALTATLPTAGLTATVAAGPPVAAAAAWPLGVLAADGELVYGATVGAFDVAAFAATRGGFLSRHLELVDGAARTGPDIVERVARAYGVGPRVLLALLELSSGWVTQPAPAVTTAPLGGVAPDLHGSLVEAAQALNAAFYAHRAGERSLRLGDGATLALPGGDAGTFALLSWLTRDATAATWSALEAPSRFWTTWVNLYGEDPPTFDTLDHRPAPLPPATLALPFPAGEVWYFVQGPAPAAGPGSPRAAIDLAPPPADLPDCAPASAPVRAVARGVVARADDEAVVLDLDGDGLEGTGWTVTYRHLASSGRVAARARVDLGDPLGYASCDGGAATTRVTLARRFNGEWIAADAPDAPLRLGAWAVAPGAAPGTGTMVAPGLPARRAQAAKADAANGIVFQTGP